MGDCFFPPAPSNHTCFIHFCAWNSHAQSTLDIVSLDWFVCKLHDLLKDTCRTLTIVKFCIFTYSTFEKEGSQVTLKAMEGKKGDRQTKMEGKMRQKGSYSGQHLWNRWEQKGKQTNRKSIKRNQEKQSLTKGKVMTIIGAIHHGTVLGDGVMCHSSIELVALWVAVDKTVWIQASQLTASVHLLLHKASYILTVWAVLACASLLQVHVSIQVTYCIWMEVCFF